MESWEEAEEAKANENLFRGIDGRVLQQLQTWLERQGMNNAQGMDALIPLSPGRFQLLQDMM
eukprot:scaffold441766_cov48-Prasinocladus_malaysianus.AAC.1